MIRTPILVWCALAILASAMLYNTSYRVRDLQNDLDHITADIQREQEKLHVLKAEWSFLTSPDRIARLSKMHLDTTPNSRTITTAQLDKVLPIGFKSTPLAAATAVIASASDTAPAAATTSLAKTAPAKTTTPTKPQKVAQTVRTKPVHSVVATTRTPAVQNSRNLVMVSAVAATPIVHRDPVGDLINRLSVTD